MTEAQKRMIDRLILAGPEGERAPMTGDQHAGRAANAWYRTAAALHRRGKIDLRTEGNTQRATMTGIQIDEHMNAEALNRSDAGPDAAAPVIDCDPWTARPDDCDPWTAPGRHDDYPQPDERPPAAPPVSPVPGRLPLSSQHRKTLALVAHRLDFAACVDSETVNEDDIGSLLAAIGLPWIPDDEE